ncbi:MAG: glycosyltransferase family 39 protein [Pseudomonas sp.]
MNTFAKMIRREISSEKLWIISLIAATCVGGYLRCHHIFLYELWSDEAFSIGVSDPDNTLYEVFQETVSDVHPAFYQILLWVIYKVFGSGQWVGRYLSLAFGVLLIPAIFVLGRMLFDTRTASIAAWLAAVNYFLIGYSRETRSYELLALLTVGVFIAFLSYVRRSSWRALLVYTVLAAMLINTHYFGSLPVFCQALLLFYFSMASGFDRRRFLQFCACMALLCVSLIPTFNYIVINVSKTGLWIPEPDQDFFFGLLAVFFGSQLLAWVALAASVVGLVSLSKQHEKENTLVVLCAWGSIALVLPYVRSMFFQSVLTERNMIIVLPAMLVLVAYAFSLLRSQLAGFFLAIFILTFSVVPVFHGYASNPPFGPSQMQDVVKVMIGKKPGYPVYATDDDVAVAFTALFKLKAFPLTIANIHALERDLGSRNPPGQFFLMSTLGSTELTDAFMSRYRIRKIDQNLIGDSQIQTFKLQAQ